MEQQIDYEKMSLINQIADYVDRLAKTEAKLTETMKELEELKKKDK